MEHVEGFIWKVLPAPAAAVVMADELRWLEIPWRPR